MSMGSGAMHLFLQLSATTAQAVLAGLWQGGALILVVALLLRLLPRMSASTRFVVWALTFALVAGLPFLSIHPGALGQGSYPHDGALHVGAPWALGMLGLWAILTSIRANRLIRQALRVRQVWLRAELVAAESAVSTLLQDSPRPAVLCTSEDLDSPGVIGFFSPRLLIPAALYPTLSPAELRQIVLHECEHLRRRDDWINLLQKIALVLFPLNPALLWVDGRLGLERELACDSAVIASTAARFDYARCLARLAEHRLGCRPVALLLSAWSHQTELTRRVQRLLLRPLSPMSQPSARASLALLTLGMSAAAVEMARVPRLVTFSDVLTVASTRAEVALNGVHEAVALAKPVALPVTYRSRAANSVAANSNDEPHATLVRATLVGATLSPPTLAPATTIGARTVPSSTMHGSSAARKHHLQQNIASRSIVAGNISPTQPHFVLTSSIEAAANVPGDARGALPVYAVARFSYSYAAVAFGDGWLIVQL